MHKANLQFSTQEISCSSYLVASKTEVEEVAEETTKSWLHVLQIRFLTDTEL